MSGTEKTEIKDTIFIRHSSEDDCWVAHSLRTDQIGTGDDIVTALADAITAIDQVMTLAHEDPTVNCFREAPADIQEMAKHAKKLPGELYEIAHLKARGDWPDTLPLSIEPPSDESFVVEGEEAVC